MLRKAVILGFFCELEFLLWFGAHSAVFCVVLEEPDFSGWPQPLCDETFMKNPCPFGFMVLTGALAVTAAQGP